MANTQTPVEELEGRDLDACVAEEVMGKVACENWMPGGSEVHFNAVKTSPCVAHDDCYPKMQGPLRYSTDIAAAWEVVGVFGDVEVHTHDNRDVWRCWLRRGGSGKLFGAAGETAPLAICRAALKAVRD